MTPQEIAEDDAQALADEVATLALLPEAAPWFECEDCGGSGEQGYEPMDWWHGSGVNVVTYPCRTCDTGGMVDYPPLALLAAYEPTEPEDVAA